MYRHLHLSVFALSAVAITSCSSDTTPAGAENANCEFRSTPNGLECVPITQSTGGSNAPGMSTSSGGGGLMDISGGGTSTGGGLMDISGNPPSASTGGANTGGASTSTPTTGGTSTSTGSTGTVPTSSGTGADMPGDGMPAGGTDDSTPATDDSAAADDGTIAPTDDGATADDGAAVTDDSASTDDSTVDMGAATLGSIVVSAGALARENTVVTFPPPFADGLGRNLMLDDGQGNMLPLQVNPVDGNFSFILPALAMGAEASFTIVELTDPFVPTVSAVQEGEHLFLKQGDTTIFRWTLVYDNFRGAAQRDVRAGYIYPIYTPGGINVGGDYGEDHPHMHGIWSAWTRTTFRGHAVDFWNGYADQGHVDLAGMEAIWSGRVHAGLIANIVHRDITTAPPVDVLAEKWIVTVYNPTPGTPYYIYDIDSTQQLAGPDPLVLEEYHYGGFGFRGAEEWRLDPNAVAWLTSAGDDRISGDGQNAKWAAQYGTINGQQGGFAGLDHPENFRHPQGLRIHPTNPYWAFVPVTPLKGGRFSIETGDLYRSRYRIVAFDGNADAALLNRLWDDYATPPTVQFTP